MNSTDYTAAIYDADTDGLTTVDVRLLDTDRLDALRTEAGQAGDLDLVATIDKVLAAR